MDKLAINGGPKVRQTPFPIGKRFGEEEKRQLMEVIDSDVMFYVFGKKVKEMETKMANMYGMKYCNGCSSGTAAVHIALGSLMIPPGKEVITSSNTDMGTLTGVLYQQLIPRFADIDPLTYNMDINSVKKLINKKTGAIIAVHHAGIPVDLDELMAVAQENNLPVIEDCAQAWCTKYKNRLVGTFGDISAFSFNHFKHITTGSGGAILTNRDDLEANVKLFIDKCYFRDGRKRNPYFLAPNYQMTELQGAVAIAQLDKVRTIVEKRNKLGMRLIEGLKQIPGIIPHKIPEYAYPSFFLFTVRLDLKVLKTTISEFCRALDAEGIPNEPNKLTGGMPIYLYDIFQKRSAFPNSAIPFKSKEFDSDVSYPKGLCPNCEESFEHTFNVGFNEFYSEADIDDIILAIDKVAQNFQ